MSCNGKPPTNPPDPCASKRSPPQAHPRRDLVSDALHRLAALAHGHWALPPDPKRIAVNTTDTIDTASEAQSIAAGLIRCLDAPPATDAVIASGDSAIALRGDTITPDLAARLADAGVGVLSHGYPTPAMVSFLDGIRRSDDGEPALLSGQVIEIGGHGLLISGPAGCGKSDITLGLVDRGHRLVADDAFLARYNPAGGWSAAVPAHFRGQLAVNGLGIINIDDVFGRDRVANEARIALEVRLCPNLRLTGQALCEGHWQRATLPALACLALPAAPERDLPLVLETLLRQRLG